MIVGQAAKLAAIGVAIGVVVALPLAPLLDSQLFGVESFDPMTFIAVPLALLAIAALAALMPATQGDADRSAGGVKDRLAPWSG